MCYRFKGRNYVEHTEGHGEKSFEAVCDLRLDGIASERLTSVYCSGPSRTWIKVKNPKAPAALALLMGHSDALFLFCASSNKFH